MLTRPNRRGSFIRIAGTRPARRFVQISSRSHSDSSRPEAYSSCAIGERPSTTIRPVIPKWRPIDGPSVSMITTLPARRTATIRVPVTRSTKPGGATRSSTQQSVTRRPTVSAIAVSPDLRLQAFGHEWPSVLEVGLAGVCQEALEGPASWSPLIRNASWPCGESISRYSELPPTVARVSAIWRCWYAG